MILKGGNNMGSKDNLYYFLYVDGKLITYAENVADLTGLVTYYERQGKHEITITHEMVGGEIAKNEFTES